MFSRFEWMIALRYLRARRREGFISVIAWFSLLGIAVCVTGLEIDQDLKDELWSYLTQAAAAMINAAE